MAFMRYLCGCQNDPLKMISQRIKDMAESATIAMSQKCREMQAEGYDIVNLSIGEPDFNTPDHIKNAAIAALERNQTHYPPVAGYPELRKAICQRLKRDLGLDYEMNQTAVSAGGKHTLQIVIMSLINSGDEVIIPAPYWVTYAELVKLAGGKVVSVECGIEQNFKITPSQLEAAITPRTKMLLINSPSNPTGAMYSRAELEALASVLRKHENVLVMADEIYDMITYGDEHCSMAQIEGMKDRTIICNGMSKGYAMTGWRVGYLAAPLEIAKACIKLQGQQTSGINTLAQAASIAALTESDEPSRQMTAQFRKRRDMMFGLLSEIKGIKLQMPPGAFYLFPNVESYFGKSYNGQIISNSSDMVYYLLTVGHVATVAGSAFGIEGYIRLSYAASEEKLREAARRIKKALEDLK